MFETASHIWQKDHAGDNITCSFRKSLTLPPGTRGSVAVAAHHFFRLYVNGKRVSGIESPAPTVFEKRRRYLSYDISALLCEGENVLAATVLYLGRDGQNHTRGMPFLLLQADFETDSGPIRLVTDTGWACTANTGYAQGLPMRERRRLTGSTCFDPGACEAGWAEAGFSDRHWQRAVVSPAQLLEVSAALQEIPEGAEIKRLTPQILFQDEGRVLYDTGEMLTGYVDAVISGPKGRQVCLRYGELLEGQREHNGCGNGAREVKLYPEHSTANDRTEFYKDEYVLTGETDHWAEDFTYRAFRYIELTGLAGCRVERLEAVKTGTALPCEGGFACSDEAVSRLAEACLETQKNALQGLLVDCPHREQAQYLGDSLMQSHLLGYNFAGADKMLQKVLRDFMDSQFTDGHFPWVCPCDSVAGTEFDLRMPEYDFMFTDLMLRLYELTGSAGLLAEFYPAAVRMMVHFLGLRDSTGLIPGDQETTIHISDWPYSNIDEAGSHLFVENAYALRALRNLAEISRLLCRESATWEEHRRQLKAAVQAHFYSEGENLFRSTPQSAQFHLGVNVLAYEEGLFPQGKEQDAREKLLKMPMETSVILSWNYLRLLFAAGEGQRAWELMTDKKSRWGLMIAEGSKTIWEGFEDRDSHSHAWNCYPLRLMQEFVLGVRPSQPGFGRVLVQPYFPEGISALSGSVWTVHGAVRVSASLNSHGAEFEITLPEAVSGVLCWQGKSYPLVPGVNKQMINGKD